MSSTISPNMSLIIPSVGTESGPTYAYDINNSLTLIDQHTHAPGSGVQITPSGLNINADLAFQSSNATSVRSIRFSAQASPLALVTDLGCLYESGVDLYFNDGSGNQIRITQGGNIVGTPGSITGLPSGTASASYSGGTFVFQSATSTPAVIDGGSVVIRNNVASSKSVTLNPPNSIGSDYNLYLPASQAAKNFLSLDASGNIEGYAAVAGGITSFNIANATITRANMVAPGQQTSGTHSLTTSTGSYVAVPSASVTITTTGNPILIIINGFCAFTRSIVGLSGYSMALGKGGAVYQTLQVIQAYDSQASTFSNDTNAVMLDVQPAGTYVYSVFGASLNTNVTASFTGISITAYEIK